VKQTLAVKLAPTEEQAKRLLETMEAFNAACNHIAEAAFRLKTANKYRLQHETYATVREQFGLSSQMAIRAISKVSEAYKRDKSIQPTFRPHGAMAYDERILSWKSADRVSLLTLKGRIVVPYRFGAYQAARMDRKRGQADLVYRGGTFYLHVATEAPEADPIEPEGILGVDLGIVEIATDSEGHSYSGEPVKAIRRRMKRIRSLLQSKGTKSARRHLKKIRRRQSRYVRDVNHVISKQIVATAAQGRKALALEDLSGIRERASGYGRTMRWLMGNWAFDQLGQFIAYKAQAVGIPVIRVDARNTSRACSRCGYCDKANRPSQAHFRCLQCGLDMNADRNAAINIGARGYQSEALMSRGCLLGSTPGTSPRF
jgi:putative transposase